MRSRDPLTLYDWPTSTCSQKVRIVLAKKELEFIDRRLDSSKRKISPTGI